jgi:hypothetical protein
MKTAMKTAFRALIVVASTYLANAWGDSCGDRTCPVDINKAISIAERARKAEQQTDLELQSAKRYSDPSNEVVPKRPVDTSSRRLSAKLKNRTYWMIHYRPRTAELGGDVVVFIDASTGDIIDVYRGR